MGPQDGWKPAPFKNYQVEFPAAAKQWLKDNADKYRVKKFVAEYHINYPIVMRSSTSVTPGAAQAACAAAPRSDQELTVPRSVTFP